MLDPGQTLDGKYRIVRLLRQGGVGAVFVATHTRIKRQVAIKVLRAGVPTDALSRFEKEAQAAGQIGSDHIVEVLDFGTLASGEPYMVMEFLQGQTLKQRVRQQALSPEQAVPIIVQLLRGLAAAHAAGIIHRDLKTDNVFLVAEKANQRDFVKILDFGICKFRAVSDEDASSTQPDVVMGTPFYMSPEQIASSSEVDERTDLYSVGVILYELVTGKAPFSAGKNKTLPELLYEILSSGIPDPRLRVPSLDAAFCEVVATATARERAKRFATASDFEAALIGWARTRTQADVPELKWFFATEAMAQEAADSSGSVRPSLRPPTLARTTVDAPRPEPAFVKQTERLAPDVLPAMGAKRPKPPSAPPVPAPRRAVSAKPPPPPSRAASPRSLPPPSLSPSLPNAAPAAPSSGPGTLPSGVAPPAAASATAASQRTPLASQPWGPSDGGSSGVDQRPSDASERVLALSATLSRGDLEGELEALGAARQVKRARTIAFVTSAACALLGLLIFALTRGPAAASNPRADEASDRGAASTGALTGAAPLASASPGTTASASAVASAGAAPRSTSRISTPSPRVDALGAPPASGGSGAGASTSASTAAAKKPRAPKPLGTVKDFGY